ncbi:Peptidoglycan-binding outer membrane protein OMP b-brl [Salinisphaera shabanensis E1L3A]|uniref:Peptidoglycan-binding outer membrane protein OMP b-brl n=1 Tax=Salinisphaera shabanensis E1L3A TaxID=1033802 RepID=U2EM21_9GAMM|nr:Peptidoglycan-binding outer membrane protein OMP b-brl [Salinisphaera shabanensis E1L3A]
MKRNQVIAFLLLLLTIALVGCNGDGNVDIGGDSQPDQTPVSTTQNSDQDSAIDANDNCPLVANEDQSDLDNDGIGNACANDVDGDDFANGQDNCTFTSNSGQTDVDDDGIGAACDTNNDGDADGVDDGIDNCPAVANPLQTDTDHNGVGDACDDDTDGDGVEDDVDNCPVAANNEQANSDDDSVGDMCQGDTDNDGVANADDNCPAIRNPDQTDTDGDDTGDACDTTPGTDNGGSGGNGGGNANVASCSVHPSTPFTPIIDPNATVMTQTSATCLLCGVTNTRAAIDSNLDNAANISVPVGLPLLGGSDASLTISSTQADDFDPGQAGLVLSSPDSLLDLELIEGITIGVLRNGVLVDEATSSNLLVLDLVGLLSSDDRRLVTFETDETYDAIRISLNGAASVLSSLDVYAGCAQTGTLDTVTATQP